MIQLFLLINLFTLLGLIFYTLRLKKSKLQLAKELADFRVKKNDLIESINNAERIQTTRQHPRL